MHIAIVGAGISGLSAAYYLHRQHRVTVFESAERIGGHTATIDVELDGQSYAIDTGFIVFNDWTYPNFIRLLDELGVASQPTEMSFSVRCDHSGLEYGGSDLNTLFAQRRNLLRPSFWRMLHDIVRFNREACADLECGAIDSTQTLGEYLRLKGYGKAFIEHYLVPMGCAIWSASSAHMLSFPLLFFVRFFKNHGLLSVNNRPQWRVIRGGSRAYLEPLVAGFKQHIITSAHISRVTRGEDGVDLHMLGGAVQRFDQVIFACHSDQALRLLGDPSAQERELLAAIPYRDNEVVLHTDASLLPHCRRAWSSWNFWRRQNNGEAPVLTYNMNMLQGITAPHTFAVTLNATGAIDPQKILGSYRYSHPVFSLASERQVKRWHSINGVRKTWFCGAYWGNGFHEDGVASARRVADGLQAQHHLPEHSGVSCA